jgi:hypothetical protein
MAKVVGDIAIKVGADFSTMTTQLNAAQSKLDGFGKRVDSQSQKLMDFQRKAAGAFAAISASLATLGAAGKFALETATDIGNLARVAGTTTSEFQSLAFAAQGFGVQQDKLSDILKDVNDKIGDFIQTGAGPMADFFENIAPKIGVTVDQFRGLSGPQALQLYISSLEKANVNQQEMTFYLEALASDVTQLAPLFIGSANALGDFSTAAQAAGVVIDEDLIRKATQMNRHWDAMLSSMQARFISFAVTTFRGFDAIFNMTEETQQEDLTRRFVSLSNEALAATDKLAKAQNDLNLARSDGLGPKEIAELETYVTRAQGTVAAVQEEEAVMMAELDRLNSIITKRMKAEEVLNSLSTGAGTGNTPDVPGAGGGTDQLASKLESLSASLMAERDVIIAEYDERRAVIDDALERERIKDAEHKDLMLKAQEDYSNKMAALELRDRSAKLAALGGMFGDLSSLMNTNNKKLFKIGKAAAIAQATVDGYQAAVSAWDKGMKMGGPPLAAAFTAASLVKTGALIAGIKSQQFGGASSSAAGAGGGAAATTTTAPAAPAASQTLNFSVTNDPFGISDRLVRQIVGAINQSQRDGSTLIRATVS